MIQYKHQTKEDKLMLNYNTTRKEDSQIEQHLNGLVTRILKEKFNSVELVHDKKRQVRGIDAIIDGMNVDFKMLSSKASLKYLPRTNNWEISVLNKNGIRYDGWGVNASLETTHLLIGVIHKHSVPDGENISNASQQVEEMELILVSKKAMLEYIENSIGFDRIKKDLWRVEGCDDRVVYNDEVKLMCATRLAEQPVNLLINLRVYRRLADKIIRYTKAA
jgi:hypothetical protein